MDKNTLKESLLKGDVESLSELFENDENVVSNFGEEFLKVINFGNQKNPNHIYVLFEHTLITIVNIDTTGVDEDTAFKLKTAALFHDIGKPNTAEEVEETGNLRYFNHAEESALLAEPILENLGYEPDEIAEISMLIRCHDEFIGIRNDDIQDSKILIEKVSKLHSTMAKKLNGFVPTVKDCKNILNLSRADAMAQSEYVVENGIVVDTLENRLKRYDAIEEVIGEALTLKNNKEIDKLTSRLDAVKNGPQQKVINGKIVNLEQIKLWKEKSTEQKEKEIEELEKKIKELNDENDYILGTSENVQENVQENGE